MLIHNCLIFQGHGSGTPFKALVVKVEEVFKKTPARFKSKPAPLPPAQPLSMTDAKVSSLLAAAGDVRAAWYTKVHIAVMAVPASRL